MKLKRMLACTLTLLLVVSLLPIGAIAADNPEGETITTPSEDIDTNYGNIQSNIGIVKTNEGTVGTNSSTVRTNNGTVETNADIVETNNGTVETNAEGGKIETNNGTVGKVDEETNDVIADSGNYGTIETNGANGTVLINQEEGVVEVNFGTIKTNESGGVVGVYYDDTEERGEFGYSYDASTGNYGEIITNEGTVSNNGGVRFYSDESSSSGYSRTEYTGCEIGTNGENGLVIFNNEGNSIGENDGTVIFNKGTVDENSGEVKVNYGTVDENSGEVKYNYGTVVNEAGGTLYEYIGEDNNLLNTITEAGTYYGIIFEEGWVYEDEQYTTEWDGTLLLQKQDGEEVDLTKLFQQDGYEVTGYFLKKYSFDYKTYLYSSGYISGTSYAVSTDSELSAVQLIWGKIKAAISSSNKPEAAAANIPTAVSAEDVKVGTIVRVKGQIFKVIEMDDDSITVVTMSALSQKDLEAPMAFLAKYLTPQQLELLQGSPEQISDELAAQLFGGNTNHIVFKAAKNLFEK